MESLVLKVDGMSCDHCVRAIEGALKELGAESKVDLASGKANVSFDEGKTALADILAAIEEQGYTVAR